MSTIAPRKVDWDLRRGIQEQLDKLERRTDKAINTLVRKLFLNCVWDIELALLLQFLTFYFRTKTHERG